MSLELTDRVSPTYATSVQRAVLQGLAYSDVFDYPLRFDELLRYLPIRIVRSRLLQELQHFDERIEAQDGYYFLAGRKRILTMRREHQAVSAPLFGRAVLFGRILGALPFVRMVALTGSLALLNCDASADLDYMLVAATGRVWLARAFALVLGKLTRVLGHTLCPNLIVSERVLKWRSQDLYSAREICQMIPIAGLEVYARLRQANSWTNSFLPNASGYPVTGTTLPASLRTRDFGRTRNFITSATEWALSGALGSRVEAWEMNRKVERFSHQAGYGSETVFNSEICQGNFDHHGAQTRSAFESRLRELGLDAGPQFDHQLASPAIDGAAGGVL